MSRGENRKSSSAIKERLIDFLISVLAGLVILAIQYSLEYLTG